MTRYLILSCLCIKIRCRVTWQFRNIISSLQCGLDLQYRSTEDAHIKTYVSPTTSNKPSARTMRVFFFTRRTVISVLATFVWQGSELLQASAQLAYFTLPGAKFSLVMGLRLTNLKKKKEKKQESFLEASKSRYRLRIYYCFIFFYFCLTFVLKANWQIFEVCLNKDRRVLFTHTNTYDFQACWERDRIRPA